MWRTNTKKGDSKIYAILVGRVLLPILRRWPLVLLIYLLVFGYGLTAIHFLMGKEFDTQGSIQISSSEFHSGLILPPKISEAQRYNDKRRYINYKYTQAELLGSDIVLNRAIDELKDKNIVFFHPVKIR